MTWCLIAGCPSGTATVTAALPSCSPYAVYSSHGWHLYPAYGIMLARQAWALDPYITESGRSQVSEFLSELRGREADAFARWTFSRKLIEEHGPAIGPPNWKSLGGGLGEIRWRAGRSQFRIYCAVRPDKRIAMLHAVKKKWAVFPPDHRELCLRRLEEMNSPAYDQEARWYLHQDYLRRTGQP